MRTTAAEPQKLPERVKQDVRQIYDAAGQAYLRQHSGASARQAEAVVFSHKQPGLYWMQHKIGTAFALGRFSRTDRLLEVGCTAGDYTMMLARDGYQVTGLDISPESIKAAQLLARNLGLSRAEFIAADVDDMRVIPDNSFDGVFSFSTLRYVPDPVRSLREVRRVLRPGGRAVVDFPNKYCPWFEFLKFVMGGERHIHDHTYSTAQVRRMMERAGFVNIEARRIIFFSKLFPANLVLLYKAVDAIAERIPGFNHSAGIIMCRGEKPAE